MITEKRMLSLLPNYLQDGINIKRYYKVLSFMYDELIDVFMDIVDSRDTNISFGYGLDILGGIVGQERNDMNDEEYRDRIKIRIMQNNSRGYVEDINQIGKAFLGEAYLGIKQGYDKTLPENEPASIYFQLNGESLTLDGKEYESRFLKAGTVRVGTNNINKTSGKSIIIEDAPHSIPSLSGAIAIGVNVKTSILNKNDLIKIKEPKKERIIIKEKIKIKEEEAKYYPHSVLQCGMVSLPIPMGILL